MRLRAPPMATYRSLVVASLWIASGEHHRAALAHRRGEEPVALREAPEQELVGAFPAGVGDDELAPIDVVKLDDSGERGQLRHRQREAEIAAVDRVAREVQVVHRLEEIGDEVLSVNSAHRLYGRSDRREDRAAVRRCRCLRKGGRREEGLSGGREGLRREGGCGRRRKGGRRRWREDFGRRRRGREDVWRRQRGRGREDVGRCRRGGERRRGRGGGREDVGRGRGREDVGRGREDVGGGGREDGGERVPGRHRCEGGGWLGDRGRRGGSRCRRECGGDGLCRRRDRRGDRETGRDRDGRAPWLPGERHEGDPSPVLPGERRQGGTGGLP